MVSLLPAEFGSPPFDGRVLSDDHAPADGTLVQPLNTADSGREPFLVSDENADAVPSTSRCSHSSSPTENVIAAGFTAPQGL